MKSHWFSYPKFLRLEIFHNVSQSQLFKKKKNLTGKNRYRKYSLEVDFLFFHLERGKHSLWKKKKKKQQLHSFSLLKNLKRKNISYFTISFFVSWRVPCVLSQGYEQLPNHRLSPGIFYHFDPSFLNRTYCSLAQAQPQLNKFVHNTGKLQSCNMRSSCWSIAKYWFILNKFLKSVEREEKASFKAF